MQLDSVALPAVVIRVIADQEPRIDGGDAGDLGLLATGERHAPESGHALPCVRFTTRRSRRTYRRVTKTRKHRWRGALSAGVERRLAHRPGRAGFRHSAIRGHRGSPRAVRGATLPPFVRYRGYNGHYQFHGPEFEYFQNGGATNLHRPAVIQAGENRAQRMSRVPSSLASCHTATSWPSLAWVIPG